jgi:transcriptional regulator with XRE-family HTH domain
MKKLTIAQRVGRNMRAARLQVGLSQDDFAEAIDMHRAQYSAMERGEKNFTLTTLHRVAMGLGVPMAELLRGVDN